MKIYIENSIPDDAKDFRPSARNITNVFDITAIERELEGYDVELSVSPLRKLRDNLWAVYVEAISSVESGGYNKTTARVALIVNYDDTSAFAMARGGSDKQLMMLIATIANKHINEPFKYDSNIRYQL